MSDSVVVAMWIACDVWYCVNNLRLSCLLKVKNNTNFIILCLIRVSITTILSMVVFVNSIFMCVHCHLCTGAALCISLDDTLTLVHRRSPVYFFG